MESTPMIRLLLFTPFLMTAAMLGAPLLIWTGMLSPLGGFGATMGAWVVGAGAGLLAGVIGIFKPHTRPLAWGALGLGVVLTGTLFLVASQGNLAPIHDVSTDLDDPPLFTVALDHPANRGRDLSYPNGHPDSAELQRRYYPDLTSTIWCDVEPGDAWQRVFAAAEDMDWTITRASTVDMVIEAEATSRIFRFVDDVVIRVQSPNDGCVHVDVRSTSRVGQSDLGANAARVADFLGRL